MNLLVKHIYEEILVECKDDDEFLERISGIVPVNSTRWIMDNFSLIMEHVRHNDQEEHCECMLERIVQEGLDNMYGVNNTGSTVCGVRYITPKPKPKQYTKKKHRKPKVYSLSNLKNLDAIRTI